MESVSTKNQIILGRLRRKWVQIVIASIAAIFALVVILGWLHSPEFASRWVIGVLIVWIYELRLLWRFLRINHPPGKIELRQHLGHGTQLTLVRGLLIAALGGFILLPEFSGILRWIPAGLYLMAAIFDGFDGFLARRNNHVTHLGAEIDLRLDALGILLASTLGIHFGQLPVWYIMVGMAYYLFAATKQIKKWMGFAVHDLPPARHRSVLAGFQMGFLVAALIPLFQASVLSIGAIVFGGSLLGVFLRDLLIAVGVLNPVSVLYQKISDWVLASAQRTILPAIRVLLLLTTILSFGFFPETLLAFPDLTYSATVPVILFILVLLISLGILPRITALLFASGIALTVFDSVGTPLGNLILTGSLILVLFGSGSFSLYPAEEQLLYKNTFPRDEYHFGPRPKKSR